MTVNRQRVIAVSLDNTLYEGLRVDFSVKKTIKSSANTATISIYNLSFATETLTLASSRDLRVRLFAGYASKQPRLIFEGNPIKSGLTSTKEGPDRVLKIEAKDGQRAYEKARVNLAFSKETKISEVVDECIAAFGLPRGSIDVPDNLRFSNGGVFFGAASDIFDDLAAMSNADWSIQNGEIQFLPRDKARTATTEGRLFSTENKTLIGSPRPMDGGGIKIKVLLDTDIIPGDRFEVRHTDRRHEGIYKAHTIEYAGSQWSDEFHCVIEGRPSP